MKIIGFVLLISSLAGCMDARRIDLDPGTPGGILLSTIASATTTLIPSGLVYPGSPYNFTQNTSITTITPTVTGTVTSCSAAPDLPAGMNLDNTTCAISGTPTTLQAATDYTITAVNSYGSISTIITINVNLPAPSTVIYTDSAPVFTAGLAITGITPALSGEITSCTSTPALPAGLLLDNISCAISGTPTAPQAVKNYTITAANSGGSVSANISIQVYSNADLNFNTTGVIIAKDTAGAGNDAAYAVTIAGDNSIAASGTTAGQGIVWRYLQDGTPDTGFNTSGNFLMASGSLYQASALRGLEFDAGGNIIAVGNGALGLSDSIIVKLDSAGALDTTFNTNGYVINAYDAGYDVAIGPVSGFYYYTGQVYFTSYDAFIIKYQTSGTQSWLKTIPDGGGHDSGNGIVLDATENSYVAGCKAVPDCNFAVWKYDSAGNPGTVKSIDALAGVTASQDTAFDIAEDSNGKIVAVGYTQGAASGNDMTILRFNPDLTADTAFNTNGVVVRDGLDVSGSNEVARGVAIDSSNRIIVTGGVTGVSGTSMFVCRYNSDGSIDYTFGVLDEVNDGCIFRKNTAGPGNNDYGYRVAIDNNGKIIVSGQSNNGIDLDMVIWRFTP